MNGNQSHMYSSTNKKRAMGLYDGCCNSEIYLVLLDYLNPFEISCSGKEMNRHFE